MFAKINHVAIVSEKYSLLAAFYQSLFGLTSSPKARTNRAITVGDGYVGFNINPRKAGRPAGLDHFGVEVEDVETVLERMRSKYPQANWGAAAEHAAIRRNHCKRSGRQCLRSFSKADGESLRHLCRERDRQPA